MAGQAEGQDEFEQLNRRFRPALMAYFMRRLRSHADAEDMTQNVFLRLAGQQQPAEMQSPEAYIFQIAANLLRDDARRDKVRREYKAAVATADGLGIDPIDPLRIASDKEALTLLRAGIGELPERTRAVFLLSRLENVDRAALAESYGVSISTIDRELARALALLAGRIRGEKAP